MWDQIRESFELLSEEWDIDPVIREFALGGRSDYQDYPIKSKDVIFHIPYLKNESKYILWKCYWPECDNCCKRQGRLPLTSDDIINISKNTNYNRPSDFVNNETLVTTWNIVGSSEGKGDEGPMITTVNLKRKKDETEKDDGKHVRCRFLDDNGYCQLHPCRPTVCYLYPFTTWMENEKGNVRVHASFQFTGDCPGFYLSKSIDEMKPVLLEYSQIVYDYTMEFNRTTREKLSNVSM